MVARSLETGLAVSAVRNRQWEGFRFTTEGALIGPSGWPLWPSDVSRLEFLSLNGVEVPQDVKRVNRRSTGASTG